MCGGQEGVQSLAAQACKAAKQSDGISDEESVLASEVQMEAFWVQTRAHLTLGNDSEAAVIAEKVIYAAGLAHPSHALTAYIDQVEGVRALSQATVISILSRLHGPSLQRVPVYYVLPRVRKWFGRTQCVGMHALLVLHRSW